MDPRDPSQRPSIFSKPEPDEERYTPEPPRAAEQWRPPRQAVEPPADGSWEVRRDPPRASYLAGGEPLGQTGPSRRLVIGLGAGALLVLLVGGFVAGSILDPGGDTALGASPSEAGSPTAAPISPTPTAAAPTVTASPSPTPEPTPAGPPQDLALGAWATVTVGELNVRSAPGTESTSNYLLVRGAVVHVAEGPTVVGGLNWYRIASLGGAVGWVFSGWEAEPFLSTLVDDPVLIRCGEVGRAVFDVVNGVPTPHDPVSIGDLALPAAAFSDVALAAMELLRGVGGDACFSAQVGSDGVPAVSAQLSVNACGHAVQDGGFFRLRPAAGQEVPVEAQVKDPAIVHPTVLVGGPPEDRKSSNLRTIVTMMAGTDDATGCINLNVTEDAGGAQASRWVDMSQCSIVHEYNADSIKLSPAAGGDTAWIKLSSAGYQPGLFPLEVPIRVAVNASASELSRDAYAWHGYGPDCG